MKVQQLPIDIPLDKITEFCQRNQIGKLSLFGSVLRDDFRIDSDVDILIELLEAASRITTQRQNELPQIPWAQITGMRNRLIHGYFDIKLDLVWDTINQDLPPLIAELENIIASEQQE